MGYSVGVIEAVPGQVPVKLLAAFAALEASVRIFSMAELAISARNPQVDVFVVAAEVRPGNWPVSWSGSPTRTRRPWC